MPLLVFWILTDQVQNDQVFFFSSGVSGPQFSPFIRLVRKIKDLLCFEQVERTIEVLF